MVATCGGTEFVELIPGLPEELALECLTRLHYSTHRVASLVCKRWCGLIQSKDFYYQRKQSGKTHKAACLVQAIPVQPGEKRIGPPSYGVTVFDSMNRTWDRVDPMPSNPNGLPLFCQLISSDGKLVLMGGWDPFTYTPVRQVFVYDFTTRRWRKGKDMPETRSFFAAGELNGRVLVAGGHDGCKNALNSAWMYDVDKDEWTELARMTQGRDECEGVVVAAAATAGSSSSEFWVVSGYKTESQGAFEASAERYDSESGEWKRVDNAWKASQCPRSCVGLRNGEEEEEEEEEAEGGDEGKRRLICWAEIDSAVRKGTCGVQLGGMTFLSGSPYQGGPHGFYIMRGQNSKLEEINVPDQFSGFVQSGCCVEI